MKPLLIALLLIAPALFGADRKFGWVPDKGKIPAPPFELRRGVKAAVIKPVTDLTPHMPVIWDQGNLGACTGFGIARVLDYAHNLRRGKFYTPSSLWIYYQERVIEGTVNEDAGAQIADGITVVNKLGAPSERCWPYVIQNFAKKPSARCYQTALNKQALKFYKLDNGDGISIRKALSMGFPVVFGAYVYEDIMNLTARSYVLPMPRGPPIGGHCMVITGSDDRRQLYTIDNSWGPEYANRGRFLMRYAYAHNRRICDDFWVIEFAE